MAGPPLYSQESAMQLLACAIVQSSSVPGARGSQKRQALEHRALLEEAKLKSKAQPKPKAVPKRKAKVCLVFLSVLFPLIKRTLSHPRTTMTTTTTGGKRPDRKVPEIMTKRDWSPPTPKAIVKKRNSKVWHVWADCLTSVHRQAPTQQHHKTTHK